MEACDPPAQPQAVPPNPPMGMTGSMPSQLKFQPCEAMPMRGSAKRKIRYDHAPVARLFIPTIVHDEDIVMPTTPNDREDVSTAKEGIELYRVDTRTIVAAVVVDLQQDENNIGTAIKCYGGVAFGGYPYDQNQDAYIVRCCDWLQIGGFGLGYRITMVGVGDWKINVPIPANVLVKQFNNQQVAMLDALRRKYPAPRYDIQFIQMTAAN